MADWKSRAVPVVSQEETANAAPKSWKDRATPVAPEVSELASAGRGAAQGLSFGLRDELAGALDSPVGGLKEIANKFGADFSDEDIEAYRKERDESRRLDEAAKAANPKSYMAGEIGGAVATSFFPGFGAARAAGLAKTVGQAALQGAAYGVGASEGESIGDIAKDAAVSGAMGGVGGAAGKLAGDALAKGAQKVGNLIGKAADPLEEAGAKAYAKAVGAPKKLFENTDDAIALGRQVRESGVVSPMASTEKMLSRTEALKDSAMAARNAAYNQIDNAGASKFNPLEVAAQVEDDILGGMNRSHLDTQELIGKLEPQLQNILSRGDGTISMAEAQQLVQSLGKKAKFDTTRSSADNELAKSVYDTVRNAINEAADSGAQGLNLGDVVRKANKDFSLAKTMEKGLRSKLGREEMGGGLAQSLSQAADIPHAVVSPKTFAVKKVLEKGADAIGTRKHQITAWTADKLASVAQKQPQAFGKFAPVLQNAARRGSQAVAATHFVLQQTSPEYREQLKSMEPDNEQEQE